MGSEAEWIVGKQGIVARMQGPSGTPAFQRGNRHVRCCRHQRYVVMVIRWVPPLGRLDGLLDVALWDAS